MVNINISLNEKAYRFLKSLKGREKSFSDIILEFKSLQDRRKGSKEIVLEFYGALKDLDIDWKEKEKKMKEFRRGFEEEINDRSRHNRNN